MTKKNEDDTALWSAFFSAEGVDEFERAKSDIVVHYQYLVHSLARKIRNRLPPQVEFDFLLSFGQEGLMKAVSKYNPTIGKFDKLASTLIYGAILDGLRREDQAPRSLRRELKIIQSKMDDLINEYHMSNDSTLSEPTYEDVADALGVEYSHVRDVMQKLDSFHPEPFHDYSTQSDEDPETLESTGNVAYLLTAFQEWFDNLPVESQAIISLRYYEEKSLHVVAKELQMNENLVRLTHSTLITDLQRVMRERVAVSLDEPSLVEVY